MERLRVIKVGGGVIENETSLALFLDKAAAMDGLKIVVHGGGRTATDVASALGIKTTMIDGRRVTDKATLDVVTMVYGGLLNKKIVAGLQARGVNALGMTGADLGSIISDRRPVRDGVDYGFVGDVRSVKVPALESLLNQGIVPVFAALTYDGKGSLLNTNADTVAAEIAKALALSFDTSLDFYFEMDGVLANPSDSKSVVSRIDEAVFKAMVADGRISGGMIPKLENAFDALRKGVGKVFVSATEVCL